MECKPCQEIGEASNLEQIIPWKLAIDISLLSWAGVLKEWGLTKRIYSREEEPIPNTQTG